MPKITFVNEKKEIDVPAGSNLRDEARKAGIELHPWIFKYPGLNCMGHGLCATCRVLVKKGMDSLSKQGIVEKISLNTIHAFESIGYEDEMRLACQCTVSGDCTVETKPPMNFSGETFWQKPYPNK
jgi:ferredoxin